MEGKINCAGCGEVITSDYVKFGDECYCDNTCLADTLLEDARDSINYSEVSSVEGRVYCAHCGKPIVSECVKYDEDYYCDDSCLSNSLFEEGERQINRVF